MNEKALTKETEKLLYEIAKEENLKEYEIENVGGGIKGEGYMGIITKIKIKDKTNKFLSLIIKKASDNATLRSTMALDNIFRREVYMYDTVFKAFQALESEKGLLKSPFSPQFYKSHLSSIPEVIILEDLKENGFKLHETKIPMDENHVSLVMAKYGRFHALSFALRDQNPQKFHQIIESMDNHFVKNMMENNFIENFNQQCTKAIKALNLNTDKQALMVYEKFLPTINSFFERLLQPVADYSVALHADCWTNNMMFKYDDQNKPIDVRFFDFQISIQGSPVLDLSYFFYTCSKKEMLKDLNHYLNIYYESFSTHLQQLGSDPEKLFPYSILQEHWKRYSKYGLIFSLLIIHIILTENEKIVDLAEASESNNGFVGAFDYEIANFEQYKERVRAIILHFVENNFI